METINQPYNLLVGNNGVIRVPFLVKGQLVAPPALSRAAIETAFAAVDGEVDYLKLPNAQLVRERIIDRVTMRYTTDYRYLLMPTVSGSDNGNDQPTV